MTELVSATELKSFVDRLEHLEEDKKNISEDIKDVFGEAVGRGFDKKILRKILKIRKEDTNKRQEEEMILDLYMTALGM